MSTEDPVVRRLLDLAARRGCLVEQRPLFPYFRGLYLRDPGSSPRILVDEQLRGPDLAFTLAHELGHHCLGAPGCWSPEGRESPAGPASEAEANRFARLLLRLVGQGVRERDLREDP